MNYAPIIIPTLCRYEHFVRCIESLKKNTWAEYTDIYIGLDYPKNASHEEGYKKIKEYLKGDFSEFHSFTVFERKRNFGATKNSKRLQKDCLKKHDRFIYSEDDMEYSPNFIQYMDIALNEYEKDPSVVAVTGYSYPIDWKVAEGCTVVKQNFNCSAWGRGFWRKKRTGFLRYLKHYGLSRDFCKAYKNNRFSEMLDPAIIEYTNFVAYGWPTPRTFLNSTTDVAMRIYLAVKSKYVVMPIVSKVRNHGFDGSGIYCQEIEFNNSEKITANNYPFNLQPIDSNTEFELIEDTGFNLDTNRALLNEFENADPEKVKLALKRAAYYSNKGSLFGIAMGIKKLFVKFIRLLKSKIVH